ncbi:MAG TPA: hypothetical protein VHF01_17500 [Candidatus Acidoferrum sp.]|nr:hypothetical protein [Candidatus Acidoferrum sp.]
MKFTQLRRSGGRNAVRHLVPECRLERLHVFDFKKHEAFEEFLKSKQNVSLDFIQFEYWTTGYDLWSFLYVLWCEFIRHEYLPDILIDLGCADEDVATQTIGYAHIKQRRMARRVPIAPNGTQGNRFAHETLEQWKISSAAGSLDMKNSLPLILPQLNLFDVEPEQFMNCDPLDVVDRGKSPVRSNIKRH